MKSEIAQAKAVAPSAEKLAQTTVDKSPEGIQSAVKESVAESTPVLRMANQVMGASNTPALASGSGSGGGSSYSSDVAKSDVAAPSSSSTYEPSYSSGSSSSSDDSGSKRRYQSTDSGYRKSSGTVISGEGPKVITTKSSNGLAPGERVVEEIDLTKGTNYKATSTAPSRQQRDTPEVARVTTGGSTRGPASAVPAAPANPGGEVAAPGAISAGSSGGAALASLNNDTPTSPAPSRRISGNRGPAASSGSIQNNAASSREEIVTFFSSGSYSLTKTKLRDTGFVDNLKTNKVTIIDLYGNSFGASRGDVIFLDDGNRFVRQK